MLEDRTNTYDLITLVYIWNYLMKSYIYTTLLVGIYTSAIKNVELFD